MKILLSLLIIVTFIKDINTNKIWGKQDPRGWESICSIWSSKPVLDNCITKSCLGKMIAEIAFNPKTKCV
jgi:hypothetical protein